MTEQPGPPGDNRPPGSTPPAGEPYSTPQYSTPNYDTPSYDPGSYDPGQGGYEPPSLKKDEPATPWADPGAPPAPGYSPTGYPGGIDPATGLPPQADQTYGGAVPSSGTGYGPSSGAGYGPASGPAYGAQASGPGYGAPASGPGYGAPASGPGYGAPGYGNPAAGGGYGAPGYGQPGAGYPTSRPNDPMAIGAMVAGIAGIVFGTLACCIHPLVGGPIGILVGGAGAVLGFLSRAKIQKANGALGGDAMALAGMICGLVAAVIGLLLTILSAVGLAYLFSASHYT